MASGLRRAGALAALHYMLHGAAHRCRDELEAGSSRNACSIMADPAEFSEHGTSALQTVKVVKRVPHTEAVASSPSEFEEALPFPLPDEEMDLPGTKGAIRVSLPAFDLTMQAHGSVLTVAVIGVAVAVLVLPLLLAASWVQTASVRQRAQDAVHQDWARAFNMGAMLKLQESQARVASKLPNAEPEVEEEPEPEEELGSDTLENTVDIIAVKNTVDIIAESSGSEVNEDY